MKKISTFITAVFFLMAAALGWFIPLATFNVEDRLTEGKHQKLDALRALGARSHLKSKCQWCGWSRWPMLLSRLVLAGPRLGTASLQSPSPSLQSPSPSSRGLLLCLSLHLSLPPLCLIRTSVLDQG